MSGSSSAQVRCAIYTRKSTEEGLDQSFNSLDAQREACEAYVRSQAAEGWRVIPSQYDDGGYSGGNLDRPAMQRLLADVDGGRVDIIVVYKVDRLTRSLTDFAKIVDRLDARGVSFVSVTQAFNTTTSMGRLTLNVLLSFAQFEREVTGERIRDKIAASKAKGMWMGGSVPLGYDLQDRRLIVNDAEAGQVRHIFERYVELRSGVELLHELRRDGIVTKRYRSRAGKTRGGLPYSCGTLYYLLQNRIYRGEIVHRGVGHDGEHDAIVSAELFDAVQQALAANRRRRRERPTRSKKCELAGLVFDHDGKAMTTSFSYGRGGRLYRYYVSGSLDPAQAPPAARPLRVPAEPLEKLVSRLLSQLFDRPLTLDEMRQALVRVELRERTIQLVLQSSELIDPHERVDGALSWLGDRLNEERLTQDADGMFRVICDRQPSFRGGSSMRSPQHSRGSGNSNWKLRHQLKAAHALLRRHRLSPLELDKVGAATVPGCQRQRRMVAIGFLAPQLQKRVMQGDARSLHRLCVERIPLAWSDQLHSSFSHDGT